jgi:nitrite reductase/ring-hydroxylating ferredoxin subunit
MNQMAGGMRTDTLQAKQAKNAAKVWTPLSFIPIPLILLITRRPRIPCLLPLSPLACASPNSLQAAFVSSWSYPLLFQSKLVEVCAVEDIGPADGSAKSFEIEGSNPPKVVMLLRNKGGVLACQTSCTKCKMPLMGADVDDKRIRCKLCGSAWSLPKGEVLEGQEGTMMSGLFASTPQTSLPIFATKVTQGKVFMGIAL